MRTFALVMVCMGYLGPMHLIGNRVKDLNSSRCCELPQKSFRQSKSHCPYGWEGDGGEASQKTCHRCNLNH